MIKSKEPLGKHDRAAFSCGVAARDDWFRQRAGQDEKRNVARVFVAIDDCCGCRFLKPKFVRLSPGNDLDGRKIPTGFPAATRALPC